MDKIKSFLISFGLIMLHVIIFPIISYSFIINNNIDNTLWSNLIELVSTLILAIILVFIYRKIFISDFKKFDRKFFYQGFKYLFFMVITLNFLVFISSQFGVEISDNEKSIRELIFNFPFIRSLMSIFLVPFIEEAIYRLSIKKYISNQIIFIITSAFIFGFLHVPNLFSNFGVFFQFLAYASSAIYLSLFYLKTNNIWSAVYLHFLNNALGVILLLL